MGCDAHQAQTAFNKIKTALQLAETVEQTDCVTESVTEDYCTKKDVFQEMDALVPDPVIFGQ